jgi:hypothetical protein
MTTEPETDNTKSNAGARPDLFTVDLNAMKPWSGVKRWAGEWRDVFLVVQAMIVIAAAMAAVFVIVT